MNCFILTRFNLRLWWNEDKNGEPVQTDDWLEERFRLFEQYCWPSVMAQTVKDFKWICLFDEGTPARFRRLVDGYKKQWNGFMPFFLDRDQTAHFQKFFQEKVAGLCNQDDPHLLTTYLDNDDCLHRCFVEKLQGYVKRVKPGTMFSFKYGVQYYEDLQLAVCVPYANNHFLSFYERTSTKVTTVWGFWHFCVFKYKGLRVVVVNNKKHPMWVELIHGGNVDNDVKMTIHQRLVTDRGCMRHFGLNVTLPGPLRMVAVFCSAFALRCLRQIARRAKGKCHR